MTNEGFLKLNNFSQWEFNNVEISSGDTVEIQIDEYWIIGVIEKWQDNLYWFSRQNGVPVVLHTGIKARLPLTKDRRTVSE